MKLCAIIPVRAGSKRVPDKNIRPFAGSNLLQIKIDQLKQIMPAGDIIVSSDSEKMLAIAEAAGCTIDHRQDWLASDSAPMNTVYQYLAEQSQVAGYDTVLFTHVTNPLCSADDYTEALTAYLAKCGCDQFDSLTTVDSLQEFIYHGRDAVNFDPEHKPRSQDLDRSWVKLNHAISIIPTDLMLRYRSIIGDRPYFHQMASKHSSVDIDTLLDFDIAEYLYDKLDFDIAEYLYDKLES